MNDLFDEYSGMIISAQCLFISIPFAFSIFVGSNSLVANIVNTFCASIGLF